MVLCTCHDFIFTFIHDRGEWKYTADSLRLLRPKHLQVEKRRWFSFCHFNSISLPLSMTFFDLWEQLISLFGYEICFFSESLLLKPCQSLLPLPSVSQLATSAPITAAHGWPLEASAALNLSSSNPSPLDIIIVDWRMRVQYLLFECHTCF